MYAEGNMLSLKLEIAKEGITKLTGKNVGALLIEYGGAISGNKRYVTPKCVSYEELNYHLVKLEKNIQKIRKRARARLL
jgi:hypothetical protein